MTEKPRIVITGGSGYVGHSVAISLKNVFNVRALDLRKPQGSVQDIEYVCCDVTRPHDVEKGLKDADLVIHAAIVQIPLINCKQRLAYEVNIIGTQNVCQVVRDNPSIKGMILPGSWHTLGERGLRGIIDEEFGFRPDKVEERARLYVLSKIAQESIVRFYDEMSEKIFGVIRMGTVLGEGMPSETAANIFVENGLKGEPITPHKHTMNRPRLYVDISDVCRAFGQFATKILNHKIRKATNSLAHIVNVYYPEPITILQLARIVQKAITEYAPTVCPRIQVISKGQESLFEENDKDEIKPDITRAVRLLELTSLKSPEESIRQIVRDRVWAIKMRRP
ncbi:NAD(P)-dependent oxidoreductase [Candidatus Bathyarchaeota archaeon]|nr:NAD(P)-dependent oxidoreductase [Candidatus Bathyarchaeota archaeon]